MAGPPANIPEHWMMCRTARQFRAAVAGAPSFAGYGAPSRAEQLFDPELGRTGASTSDAAPTTLRSEDMPLRRVVERVDESLKADVMHWAAIFVSRSPMRALLSIVSGTLISDLVFPTPSAGKPHANRQQKDLPLGSMGRQGYELAEGKFL